MDNKAVNLSLKRDEPVPDFNELWADDRLERYLYAPALTTLVGDSVEPLVVAVNGGWGTGKTFFLDRWGKEFEKPLAQDRKPGRVIYFSAWQDDDLDNPLLAIVGQLHRNLHARPLRVDESVKEGAETKAGKFLQVANRVVSVAGKHADIFAEHWIGVKPVEFVRECSNRMAQRVDTYSAAIDARVDLKERLRDLANENFSDSGKPLVFVIDDLDRCKPLFEIATLERIKHFFDVRHVVFVLGVDLVQFGKALANVYGDLDVANYLNRLIDIEFALPEPSRDTFVDYLWSEYFGRYFKEADADQAELSAASEYKDVFLFLAKKFKMTLRDMERVTREFVAVEKSVVFKNAREATLLALLCSLRLCNPDVYKRFVTANASAPDMINAVLGEFTPNARGVKQHLQEAVLASYKEADQRDAARVQHIVAALRDPFPVEPTEVQLRKTLEAAILDSPINQSHLRRMQTLLSCFSVKNEEDW